MRLTSGGHLTYCMNIHPGESWEDVVHAVRTYLPEVKATLCPGQPLGVGLRLSAEACETSAGREGELRDALEDVGAYAFTVNAFPYGAFHHTRVKENVYLPDWSEPARVTYTLQAARLLSTLLPEGMEGSISTVPLGYKYERRTSNIEHRTSKVLANLCETARGLQMIYQETGKLIHLGLEPEPDCILETTEETVSFFRELFQYPQADQLRTYIGVCLDTCHVALQFEDPAEALNRYLDEGIRISKIQLSAALEAEAADISAGDLTPFDEGVYLHQVTSSSGKRWRDLPDWLASPDPTAGKLRIHCHVPMDWQGNDPLRSTRHTLGSDFIRCLCRLENPHLEVETYTFNVLPPDLRGKKSITQSITDECTWALNALSDLNATES